ncbi:fam-h protein [Plasmodium relictum]|uniref:Fam-h protein n=1 Tax=Plasmodium relictum TaxID=85471 RepID=A0A1J1GKF9_PLARL|nr:fam-h protein [Plasmodium relictum]CRG85077.1 fam-h protein [Plasmodium relictum]
MIRKSNLMWNICVNSGYYSHIAKDYIAEDISNSKIYNKKEKKNIFNFFTNFFIFAFLIWILQCSNNWNSCKTWHHENDLKNVLNLGDKRSLAENKGVIKQRNEGLKLYEEQDIIELNLDLENGKMGIEENMDVEQENEQEIKEKNKKLKLKENILGKCKNYLKLISLSILFLLSFCSLILILIDYAHPNLSRFVWIMRSSEVSVLIFSILILYEQIKKKRNNKS